MPNFDYAILFIALVLFFAAAVDVKIPASRPLRLECLAFTLITLWLLFFRH